MTNVWIAEIGGFRHFCFAEIGYAGWRWHSLYHKKKVIKTSNVSVRKMNEYRSYEALVFNQINKKT